MVNKIWQWPHMAYQNTQEIRGRAKRYSSYKISRSQRTTRTFHKNKPPYKESKPKTTLSNKDTNIHIESERLRLMMESESVTSSQGRVGRRACQVLLVGGWSQEELHPPPKGWEWENERMTQYWETNFYHSFIPHGWGYIGTWGRVTNQEHTMRFGG